MTNSLKRVSQVDNRLNIVVYGPDPFRLSVLPLPGAEAAAEDFAANSDVPLDWDFAVGHPPNDPLVAVLVQDESGDSLQVFYDDLECVVLPPKDGMVTIIMSLDEDFELTGPRGHLYQAVANSVVTNLLGGYPLELARAVLLPRPELGAVELFPVRTLRQLWIDVVGPAKP